MSQDAEQTRALYPEPEKSSAPPGGVNHLLVIGIDGYEHHPRLNNARRDAEAFRKLLTAYYQFDPERVIELYDEAATRRRIIETLENLERRLKPSDNLLIYFSGHGTMNAKKSQGFWVPVDAEKTTADYLPNDQVRAMIRDMEAHHIYLIVDACFSGSMILRSTSAHELLEQNPSRRVLTSGRQELVSDGTPGGHSPFFDCIRHQLSQGQPLSAIELETYVIHNTPRTAHQLPEAEVIFGVGDQSGKFVFHPRRDEARDWADAQAEHTPAAYRRYLDAYPQGAHREEAIWQTACLQPQDKQGYRAYLAQFPRGVHALAAIERIDFLDRELRYQEALRRGEAGLHRFLQDYPEGPFADDARTALSRILAAEQEAKQRENEARRAQEREAEQKRNEELDAQRRRQAEEAAAKEKARLQAEEEAHKARERKAERQSRQQPTPAPQEKIPRPAFDTPKSPPINWRIPAGIAGGVALLLLVWQMIPRPAPGPTGLAGTSIAAADTVPKDSPNVEKPQPTIPDTTLTLLGSYHQDIARYEEVGKTGYVRRDGTRITPARYDKGEDFKNGAAIIYLNGKRGYIDLSGKEIISPRYDLAGSFDEKGQAEVKQGGRSFTIDKTGAEQKPDIPLPEIEMVRVQGGTFTMGGDAHDDEKPLHQVRVGDFYIGKYEVTQAQWRAVMGTNPSNFKNCDQCPVEKVSWNEMKTFIQKLNVQTGHRYRLPTEAEWEYAAGGGSGSRTTYAGTSTEASLGNYA